jgi:hypothetical protein
VGFTYGGKDLIRLNKNILHGLKWITDLLHTTLPIKLFYSDIRSR